MHLQDEELLKRFYPYLAGPDIYDCRDEKKVCKPQPVILRTAPCAGSDYISYRPLIVRKGRLKSADCCVQVPVYWECEALEMWQPIKRKRSLARRCNLPYGKPAQKEWEATRHLQTPLAQVGY